MLIQQLGGASNPTSDWLINMFEADLTWNQIQEVAQHPHVEYISGDSYGEDAGGGFLGTQRRAALRLEESWLTSATLGLGMRRISTVKIKKVGCCHRTRVILVKNKLVPPGRVAELDVRYGIWLRMSRQLLDKFVERDMIGEPF